MVRSGRPDTEPGGTREGTAAADVSALVGAGRHEEAAELLYARGELGAAAGLFAAVWKFERAVAVARQAGLLRDAYEHAVASKNHALIEEALVELLDQPDLAREASAFAGKRGRSLDAARLSAAAGDLAEAARAFEEAGELAKAAELMERGGDLKGAGKLYERHLIDHDDDAVSVLALGRILLRFGRTEAAVKRLQTIERHQEHGEAAERLLILGYDRLGLRAAALSVFDRKRARDPGLPPTLEAYLARDRPAEGLGADPQLIAGRYRMLNPLGEGGTGRVFRAEDTFSGRDVAVKVLSRVEGAKGRDALVRFAREARLSAGLEHPSIVRVLDYIGDGPYLVMELMSGGTLEDRLGKNEALRPLPPLVARHVLGSILRALDAAHRRGVVHRDVKPGNIFFGPGGEVKLGDFGAAHLLDVGATRTGALIGTLAYMAPEQIASSSSIHPATDLYATSVLAYAMLLGALPFAGPDFVEEHLRKTPPAPSRLAPPWLRGVGLEEGLGALDALLLSMLEKSPEARPESALTVLAALDRLPWDAWQRDYEADLQGDAPPAAEHSTRVPSVAPAAPDRAVLGRYREIVMPGGPDPRVRRAEDELLQREVELVALPGPASEHLRKFAKVMSPHLQAIYAEAEGTFVLEALGPPIEGNALSDAMRADLSKGLRALHAQGLTHGALTLEAIAYSADPRGGAVIRMPLEPREGSLHEDLSALDQLGR